MKGTCEPGVALPGKHVLDILHQRPSGGEHNHATGRKGQPAPRSLLSQDPVLQRRAKDDETHPDESSGKSNIGMVGKGRRGGHEYPCQQSDADPPASQPPPVPINRAPGQKQDRGQRHRNIGGCRPEKEQHRQSNNQSLRDGLNARPALRHLRHFPIQPEENSCGHSRM